MNTSHPHPRPEQIAYIASTPSPQLASNIVREGYVSYQQAVSLGFVPTPHSLYTVIVTTIRDVHHPDAYNVAYLLGWLVAYYEEDYHQQSIDQHLSTASLHLRLASALIVQQEVMP